MYSVTSSNIALAPKANVSRCSLVFWLIKGEYTKFLL